LCNKAKDEGRKKQKLKEVIKQNLKEAKKAKPLIFSGFII